ncbi:MAG TPA: sigma-70 family RNA polymerase sigma factor [Candidatus Limnocylindrales bacterium]|nr:sigma-70 family RNA polymerase sigma factor [Candidatus Limnocylindrales bacterium]
MWMIVLPDPSEDDTLLAAARQGSPAALTEIYDFYFQPIYSFIRLRVDDAPLAEDLTSEVFIRLVEAVRGRGGPRSSLRGWLFKVARNLVHDHYRGRHALSEQELGEWMASPNPDPEAHAIYAASIDQVRRALLGLNPDHQEVLILRFTQNLSLQETAEIMGRRTNAIKQLQFRATQALQRALAPALTETDHG